MGLIQGDTNNSVMGTLTQIPLVHGDGKNTWAHFHFHGLT